METQEYDKFFPRKRILSFPKNWKEIPSFFLHQSAKELSDVCKISPTYFLQQFRFKYFGVANLRLLRMLYTCVSCSPLMSRWESSFILLCFCLGLDQLILWFFGLPHGTQDVVRGAVCARVTVRASVSTLTLLSSLTHLWASCPPSSYLHIRTHVTPKFNLCLNFKWFLFKWCWGKKQQNKTYFPFSLPFQPNPPPSPSLFSFPCAAQ